MLLGSAGAVIGLGTLAGVKEYGDKKANAKQMAECLIKTNETMSGVGQNMADLREEMMRERLRTKEEIQRIEQAVNMNLSKFEEELEATKAASEASTGTGWTDLGIGLVKDCGKLARDVGLLVGSESIAQGAAIATASAIGLKWTYKTVSGMVGMPSLRSSGDETSGIAGHVYWLPDPEGAEMPKKVYSQGMRYSIHGYWSPRTKSETVAPPAEIERFRTIALGGWEEANWLDATDSGRAKSQVHEYAKHGWTVGQGPQAYWAAATGKPVGKLVKIVGRYDAAERVNVVQELGFGQGALQEFGIKQGFPFKLGDKVLENMPTVTDFNKYRENVPVKTGALGASFLLPAYGYHKAFEIADKGLETSECPGLLLSYLGREEAEMKIFKITGGPSGGGFGIVHKGCVMAPAHVIGKKGLNIGSRILRPIDRQKPDLVVLAGRSADAFEPVQSGERVSIIDIDGDAMPGLAIVDSSGLLFFDFGDMLPTRGASGLPIVRDRDSALVGMYSMHSKHPHSGGNYWTQFPGIRPIGSGDAASIKIQSIIDRVRPNTVVHGVAPLGSGKTMRVVPACVESKRFAKVIVCEPTRITAKRAHESLSKKIGRIALRTGEEKDGSADTADLVVCTAGWLAAKLAATGKLWRKVLIVIDECHETSGEYLYLLAVLQKYVENNLGSGGLTLTATPSGGVTGDATLGLQVKISKAKRVAKGDKVAKDQIVIQGYSYPMPRREENTLIFVSGKGEAEATARILL